jgi:hypothetical protein
MQEPPQRTPSHLQMTPFVVILHQTSQKVRWASQGMTKPQARATPPLRKQRASGNHGPRRSPPEGHAWLHGQQERRDDRTCSARQLGGWQEVILDCRWALRRHRARPVVGHPGAGRGRPQPEGLRTSSWAIARLSSAPGPPKLPNDLLDNARKAFAEVVLDRAERAQQWAVDEARSRVTARTDFDHLECQIKDASLPIERLQREERLILEDVGRVKPEQRRVLEGQLNQVRMRMVAKQDELTKLRQDAAAAGAAQREEAEAERRASTTSKVQGVQGFELEWRCAR